MIVVQAPPFLTLEYTGHSPLRGLTIWYFRFVRTIASACEPAASGLVLPSESWTDGKVLCGGIGTLKCGKRRDEEATALGDAVEVDASPGARLDCASVLFRSFIRCGRVLRPAKAMKEGRKAMMYELWSCTWCSVQIDAGGQNFSWLVVEILVPRFQMHRHKIRQIQKYCCSCMGREYGPPSTHAERQIALVNVFSCTA